MSQINPIRNQILFKPFPPDVVTEGGLIVPESAQKPNNKGVIVKVGNGTKDRPMKLKAGDVAIRVQGWGQEILIDGELHFIMDADAILTTVKQ